MSENILNLSPKTFTSLDLNSIKKKLRTKLIIMIVYCSVFALIFDAGVYSYRLRIISNEGNSIVSYFTFILLIFLGILFTCVGFWAMFKMYKNYSLSVKNIELIGEGSNENVEKMFLELSDSLLMIFSLGFATQSFLITKSFLIQLFFDDLKFFIVPLEKVTHLGIYEDALTIEGYTFEVKIEYEGIDNETHKLKFNLPKDNISSEELLQIISENYEKYTFIK